MAQPRKSVTLSLGSNLGDRVGQIEKAVELLDASGVGVVRRSSFYETEPLCGGGQRWFVNCVVEAETDLMPLALLGTVRRIERQLGRRPASGLQPTARSIDIDILFYGNHVVVMPELTIPHPRLAERRFVLEPLRELGSDRQHPVTRQTVADMLAGLRGHGAVRRLPG
jgi:2-amino-4-hydroxy-6-hydroxymethyldihydropteridine diphosphokinase